MTAIDTHDWSTLPPRGASKAERNAFIDANGPAASGALKDAFFAALDYISPHVIARWISQSDDCDLVVDEIAGRFDLVEDEPDRIDDRNVIEDDALDRVWRALAEGDAAAAQDALRDAFPHLRPVEAERRLAAARAATAHLFARKGLPA